MKKIILFFAFLSFFSLSKAQPYSDFHNSDNFKIYLGIYGDTAFHSYNFNNSDMYKIYSGIKDGHLIGSTGSTGSTGAKGSTGSTGSTGSAGLGYSGLTAASLNTISLGSQVFVTNQPNSQFSFISGGRIRCISSTPSDWMEGVITSFTGNALYVNIDLINGAGSFSSWSFSIAGATGAAGSNGTNGNTGATGAAGSIGALAAFGASPNANGATLSGSTLNLEYASASFGGSVSTGTQTFAGSKTFNSDLTVNGVIVGKGHNSVASNTVIGNGGAVSITTGSFTTAVGYQTIPNITTGANNTALGYNVLGNCVAGSNGVAIGYAAMQSYTSTATPFTNDNTVLGYQAFAGSGTIASNTGTGNTVAGYQTLFNNSTGSNNTTLGYKTLQNNTTGAGNTVIGYNTAVGLTTGNYNTIIGASISGLSSSLSNNIILSDGQGVIREQFDNLGQVTWGADSVFTVSPTSPNRTIRLKIGSTVYYLSAKTTNN